MWPQKVLPAGGLSAGPELVLPITVLALTVVPRLSLHRPRHLALWGVGRGRSKGGLRFYLSWGRELPGE